MKKLPFQLKLPKLGTLEVLFLKKKKKIKLFAATTTSWWFLLTGVTQDKKNAES